MTLYASSANPDQIDIYTSGSCHILAVALHRKFGWGIHVVLDQDERYWEDPADADNWIASVIHVYAVDNHGNAWDIQGVRPLSEVRQEIQSMHTVGEYDSDDVYAEDELKSYVGCWTDDPDEEPIDRPLFEYDEQDVAEAAVVADEVLSVLPGYHPVRAMQV